MADISRNYREREATLVIVIEVKHLRKRHVCFSPEAARNESCSLPSSPPSAENNRSRIALSSLRFPAQSPDRLAQAESSDLSVSSNGSDHKRGDSS